jgi:DNA-binding CsgD family transcriptional regulator
MLLDDLRSGLPASCALARPSGRLPLAIVATPMRDGRGEQARLILGMRAMPVGILAIHEAEAIDDAGTHHDLEGRLKAMFGLTAGEARVAVAVYQTPGLQAVADRLGISRATIQTHLRHVFQKMDISTQSELARRVQTLATT